MVNVQDWRHVFKLDPDKSISDQALEAICLSDTDALIVGGTYGVTYTNTLALLSRIKKYNVPCVLEVSNHKALVPGFDHYFIPVVLNAMAAEWILQPHQEVVKRMGALIPWEQTSGLAYCVLNPDSGVAQLTRSKTSLQIEDIIAYGRVSQHLLKMPFFYLEYSGCLADPLIISQVYSTLKKESDIHIFYGGGIQNWQQAQQMKKHCDTLVVGNVIYENLEAALATVHVKEQQLEGACAVKGGAEKDD